MRSKTIWIYALGLAACYAVLTLLDYVLVQRMGHEWLSSLLKVAGNANLLVGFSLALQAYRRTDLSGTMSFGQGMRAGLLVSLILGVCSALFLGLYFGLTDVRELQLVKMRDNLQAQDLAVEEVERNLARAKTFLHPGILALGGLMSTLFFGAMVTAIYSALQRTQGKSPLWVAKIGTLLFGLMSLHYWLSENPARFDSYLLFMFLAVACASWWFFDSRASWPHRIDLLFGLLLLLVVGVIWFTRKPTPEPNETEIALAWVDAGAERIWFQVGPHGLMKTVPEGSRKSGDLPGFRFRSRNVRLAYLPAPKTPFVLDLPSDVMEADLKDVSHYKNLQGLLLGGTQVTDAGLKRLAPLKNLQTLRLGGTQVTDAGLKELAPLKNLRTLSLDDKRVTDKALRTLREIGLLHALFKAKAKDGKRPSSPADVTSLILDNTQVTDAGLKELAPLKNLQTLFLDDTQVTDAGLKVLAPLENLLTLSLWQTEVTDAGLKELAPLKNLQTLLLDDTKVTDAGLNVLHQALPDCEIMFGDHLTLSWRGDHVTLYLGRERGRTFRRFSQE